MIQTGKFEFEVYILPTAMIVTTEMYVALTLCFLSYYVDIKFKKP